MSDNSRGYRLHWQDLRTWKPFQGKKKPAPAFEDFPTKAAAEAKRTTFPVHEDMIITITEIPPRVRGASIAPR